MAGDEQGEQLVAHLTVREALPVLVPGGQQEREDVVAPVGVGPVHGDLLLEQPLGGPAGAEPREHPGGDPPPEEPGLDALGEHRHDAHAEDAGQDLAQPFAAPLVADPEHHGEDHLERDRAHAGQDGMWLAERPAPHVLERGGPDQLAVAAQRLAVKGRQQEPTQPQVAFAVGHEDRPAGRRADESVRLAGTQDVRGRR